MYRSRPYGTDPTFRTYQQAFELYLENEGYVIVSARALKLAAFFLVAVSFMLFFMILGAPVEVAFVGLCVFIFVGGVAAIMCRYVFL